MLRTENAMQNIHIDIKISYPFGGIPVISEKVHLQMRQIITTIKRTGGKP